MTKAARTAASQDLFNWLHSVLNSIQKKLPVRQKTSRYQQENAREFHVQIGGIQVNVESPSEKVGWAAAEYNW